MEFGARLQVDIISGRSFHLFYIHIYLCAIHLWSAPLTASGGGYARDMLALVGLSSNERSLYNMVDMNKG